VESTIIDCSGEVAVILRPGAVTREMLEELLGEVQLDPALVGANTVPRAPGMKYTHYAPKAPLTLLEGSPSAMLPAFKHELARLKDEGKRTGVIASHEVLAELSGRVAPELVYDYGAQGDLRVIAANIYEALRSFDHLPADVLLAEGVTDEGLGLAIMNRLHKASGFQTVFVDK
jgi:L-threonylcarbamoyladenylate synthase